MTAAHRAPKRARMQLVKAELWMHVAGTVERWCREVLSNEPGTIPFSEWPDEDPLVALCRTYGLAPRDLAKVCGRVAQESENRAVRAGYADYWDDPAGSAP